MTNSTDEQTTAPEDSTPPTLLEWAKKQLAHLEGFPEDADYFSCGVFHGLKEFSVATATLGTGEEHRTAAAMGFISSHLSWYQLLAEIAGEQSKLDCSWGVVSKKDESEVGIDFAIAIDTENGFYNVCCCQAKNATEGTASTGVQFDIDQMPGSLGGDKAEVERNQAHDVLRGWLKGKLPDPSIQQPITKNHQVVKMAYLERDLVKRSGTVERKPTHSSVHYVIWRDGDQAPCTVPLETVKQQLVASNTGSASDFTKSGISKEISKLTVGDPCSFAALVSSGRTAGAPGWTQVAADAMQGLVSSWVALGVSWLLIDRGSGMVNLEMLKTIAKDANTSITTRSITSAIYEGPRLPAQPSTSQKQNRLRRK